MKKISKKKNLLTKTGLGVVAASLVMTPIITAVACGTDASTDKPIKPSGKPSYKSLNIFEGKFSTPEKEEEFLNITSAVPDNAFMNEKELISVTLPDVLQIGENAFAMENPDSGNQLVEVNLPKVRVIKYNAFHNANVTKIDFPNAREVGKESFNQAKLTSISLASIEIIEIQNFSNVISLTKLFLPKVVTIGLNAFDSLRTLDELNLPMVDTIGDRAFMNAKIKKLISPNLVNVGISTFSWSKFENMGGTLILPKLRSIDSGAFYSAQFTRIELPDLRRTRSRAFEKSEIRFLKIPVVTIALIDNFSFYGTRINAEITVADKSLWEGNVRLERIFGANYQAINFFDA